MRDIIKVMESIKNSDQTIAAARQFVNRKESSNMNQNSQQNHKSEQSQPQSGTITQDISQSHNGPKQRETFGSPNANSQPRLKVQKDCGQLNQSEPQNSTYDPFLMMIKTMIQKQLQQQQYQPQQLPYQTFYQQQPMTHHLPVLQQPALYPIPAN